MIFGCVLYLWEIFEILIIGGYVDAIRLTSLHHKARENL
jgi:hypothetical protein